MESSRSQHPKGLAGSFAPPTYRQALQERPRVPKGQHVSIRTVQISSIPRKCRAALEQLEAQQGPLADHHRGMGKFQLEEAP